MQKIMKKKGRFVYKIANRLHQVVDLCDFWVKIYKSSNMVVKITSIDSRFLKVFALSHALKSLTSVGLYNELISQIMI